MCDTNNHNVGVEFPCYLISACRKIIELVAMNFD